MAAWVHDGTPPTILTSSQWSPPSGHHRYASRQVLLGPVEEAGDRGLERLDTMPLVSLHPLRAFQRQGDPLPRRRQLKAPAPEAHHRAAITSREVVLGPVDEAQDRGLERLGILTLVFLRSLRMSARARRRSRAGIPIMRGAEAGFVFSHGERGKCYCGRPFGRAH
jgi:hypothetical protein